MNRLPSLLVASVGALLASACASAPAESIPLLVTKDLEVRPIEASAPSMATTAIPAPMEATKWTRMRDPDLEPVATLGGYVQVSLAGIDPEGVLDGTVAVSGPSDVILLPDVDLDVGGSIALGYRGYKYGGEISYELVEHEGDYGTFDEDARFHAINADVKRYFWPESRLQPYYTVGVGYIRSKLDNASFDDLITPTIQGDAEITGVTANFGVGFNYLITRRLSLDARALYRYGEYLDGEGVLSGQEKITGDAEASSYGAMVGLMYVLNPDD